MRTTPTPFPDKPNLAVKAENVTQLHPIFRTYNEEKMWCYNTHPNAGAPVDGCGVLRANVDNLYKKDQIVTNAANKQTTDHSELRCGLAWD